MNKDKQYSESLRIGLLLALTGGFLDAYTYLCRGQVFANAQTGNIVLLGISLIQRNTNGIIKYLIPIFSFAIGVLLAEFIKEVLPENKRIHWRQIILCVEVLIILGVTFLDEGRYNYLVNTLVSLVCALQVEGFRKFHGNTYATTMCTGNLRSGTEQLVLYIKNKNRNHLIVSFQYYLIICTFCLGAAMGGFFIFELGVKAVCLACLPLLLAFLIMAKK